MKKEISRQTGALREIIRLLAAHGFSERAEGLSRVLQTITHAPGHKEKRKIIKEVARRMPTGYGGYTDISFGNNGRVLIDETREYHKNLERFFEARKLFW